MLVYTEHIRDGALYQCPSWDKVYARPTCTLMRCSYSVYTRTTYYRACGYGRLVTSHEKWNLSIIDTLGTT